MFLLGINTINKKGDSITEFTTCDSESEVEKFKEIHQKDTLRIYKQLENKTFEYVENGKI